MSNPGSKRGSVRSRRIPISTAPRIEEADYIKRLLAAGTRASALGIAVLDSETRFESVNAALSHETRASADHHVGRTSSEIVGSLARQIEPTYEKVLRTGKAASVVLTGHVRDTPEYGYWLDHCFPIFDPGGRVQKLSLFVVNVTAEYATSEILEALATISKRLTAANAGILDTFNEAIRHFHFSLQISLQELACPLSQSARNMDHFRSSINKLDEEVRQMRELIYSIIAQFTIPKC